MVKLVKQAARLCGGISLILCLTGGFARAEMITPAEFLAKRPNNLEAIPPELMKKSVQLSVAFSLRDAPNSEAANAFLARLLSTMRELPHQFDVQLHRQIFPPRFQYVIAFSFRTWGDYVAHEKNPALIKFYREQWKPAVAEAEERLSIPEEQLVK